MIKWLTGKKTYSAAANLRDIAAWYYYFLFAIRFFKAVLSKMQLASLGLKLAAVLYCFAALALPSTEEKSEIGTLFKVVSVVTAFYIASVLLVHFAKNTERLGIKKECNNINYAF